MRGLILLQHIAGLATVLLPFGALAAEIEANNATDSAPKSAVAVLNAPPEPLPSSKAVEAPAVSPAPANAAIQTAPKSENDAAASLKISGTVTAKPVDDPALPVRIPGYELRVLDVRKDVLFRVNGTWVQAAVPVFFYFPTTSSERTRGLDLLRQVRSDARKLGEISTEKSPELERVIANLDEALTALEKQP